jgi:serine/threonine-protein kinase
MTTPRLLSERYELGDTLGYGGMSEVHRGRDMRLSRDVAVKVLRADLARDPQFQMRFRREAQNAAALNHPAIVAVYDTGEVESEFGPLPYIVMEFVDGQTLREIVKTQGPFSQQRVIEVMADVCAALDFSHRHGIIHRDVKPANVMITKGGAVKVMDFGIARALADGQNMTQTAAVIGTAQYLSPEQARGEAVDARSDVYAAGCVLFELLTGEPPFSGDSPVAVAYQHVREDPRRPSEVNSEVPAALDAIGLKAMSKNPANRYQSAAEMRSDLVRVLRGQRPLAPAVMTEEERTALLHGPAPSATATRRLNQPTGANRHAAPQSWETESSGRSTGKVIGIGVGVVAMLAIVVFVATRIFGSVAGPEKVAVPIVAGLSMQDARAKLTAAGLNPDIKDQGSTEKVGNAISTDPPSGAQVAKNSRITLLISKGPDPITVPALTGMSAAEAVGKLPAGITLAAPQQTQSTLEQSQDGKIISQSPKPGETAKFGSTIKIVVGHYVQPVYVPQVVGMNVQDAQELLTSTPLQPVVSPSGASAEARVIDSTPKQGQPVAPNSKVTLTVSSQDSGGNGGNAPNVKGQRENDAKATLEDRGFTNVKTHRQSVNDQSQDGRVVDQTVDSNGKVDLYVGRYGNSNNGDDPDGDFPGDRPDGRNNNNNSHGVIPNGFGFGN